MAAPLPMGCSSDISETVWMVKAPSGKGLSMDGVQENDHDLLVRLDERVGQLLKWTQEHNTQHASQRRGIWAALTAGIVAMFSALLGWLFRN